MMRDQEKVYELNVEEDDPEKKCGDYAKPLQK